MLGIKGPLCEKWINFYSHACNDILQINKGLEVGYRVLFNGDMCYEIQARDDTHIVCLDKKTYTCKA